MKLSDTACRAAKAKAAPYKLSDGGGLQLWVHTTGSRTWRLAYRHSGKQKTITLGTYPETKLVAARELRDAAKRKLREGIDPAKRMEVDDGATTFEQAARDWFDAAKTPWAESHAARVWNRIEKDVLPDLGDKDIRSIKPGDVVATLRKIEGRGAIDMAKRVRQSISSVFRYAVATGVVEVDPAASVGAVLKSAPKVVHHAFVPAKELPELLGKIVTYDGDVLTKFALTLTLQTMVRTNETQFAEWAEFEDLDGDKPLWRIPPERMKRSVEHLVPLATQTVALLDELRSHSGQSKFLFPSKTITGVMSNNTMLYALYRMGYHSRATVHGFRRTASTILNESSLFDSDWIELQLAHVEDNKIRKAYNAAEYMPARRKMVQWWNDYLETTTMTRSG